MYDACKMIQRTITAAGGNFNFRMMPKVVTAEDGDDLAELMAKSKIDNTDMFGDKYDDPNGRKDM